jgi:protocatechuate 3,4-dioxygenase beta subunit
MEVRSARGFSRTALLVIVLTCAAFLAVLNLLIGAPFRRAADRASEREVAAAGVDAALTAGAAAALEAAPGADPETRAAARERARAAAQAPRFPRSEGVFGFVVDGRGKPVAGATVKLFRLAAEDVTRWPPPPDREPAATATTGEDGSFLVGPAPPEAFALRLRAEAPGFAPTTQQVARRGTRVDLVLDRGGELRVRALDAEGAPLDDAAVLHTAGTVSTSGYTDAEGRAVLGSVPTGQGSLLVVKEGHGAARRPDVAVAPGEALEVTVLLGKPIVLSGRVVTAQGDQPVADAEVVLSWAQLTMVPEPPSVLTGADGAFRFELAAPLGEQFALTAESEGRTGRTHLNVNDTGGGTMDAVVKLADETVSLAGRVVDARGKPAEGVRVTLSWSQPGVPAPETTTSDDGQFDLPLPPGSAPGSSYHVLALHDTLGIGSAQGRVPKPEERANPLVVTLSGAGGVRGRVVGPEGPVDGALVALTVDWALMRQSGARFRGGADWSVMNVLQDPRRGAALNAVSGADGSFVLPSVPAATFRITATHGSTQATPSEPVVVTAGGVTEVEIPLGAGLTLAGSVVDGAGAPVAGAWVYATATTREGRWGGRQVGARSQSDGTFTVRGVSDGSWNLQAWAAGYAGQMVQNVAGGTSGHLIRLQAMGWIEGVVLDGGRPYRGPFSVSVTNATQAGAREEVHFPHGGQNEQAFNTDDGRFTFKGLGAGSYLLQARTPDGRITRQAVRADVANGRATTDVALPLAVGGTVAGTVVDEETGRGIGGANLQLVGRTAEGGTRTNAGAATDAGGRFLARGLAPGPYTIHVTPPNGVTWIEEVEVGEGQTKDVRFVARQPGQIRIHVVDAEHRPVEGAQPTVTTAMGGQVWPSWQALQREGLMDTSPRGDVWQRFLRTGADGVNLRHHVPPGRYQVSAQLQGYAAPGEPVWVEVAPRRTTEVTVVLAKSADAGDVPGAEAQRGSR